LAAHSVTLQGAGRFGYERGEMRALPGEVVLIRPNTRHDYVTAPDLGHSRLTCGHFQPRLDWHEWLVWPYGAGGLMYLVLQEPILQRIAARLLEMHQLTASSVHHVPYDIAFWVDDVVI